MQFEEDPNEPKFKVGDRVKVVIDELQPQMVGRVGTITKEHHGLYQVVVDGQPLRGVALYEHLELVKE